MKWQKELNLAIKATKIGASVIKKYYSEPNAIVKGIRDVVTSADVEAETAIKKFLLGKTNYGFIGEELGRQEGSPTWAVDPIDGTRAFIFGIPNFSTTIALIDKETVLGVVYNPITKELYTATKANGAFLNRRKLTLKAERPIKESVVGCAFEYSRKELHDLSSAVNTCLVNLSCALDVCRTATGRVDGAVFGLSKVYDHAAAGLIAQEARIKVTNFGTETWNPFDLGVIAAKPKLHQFLSDMFPTPLTNLNAAERSWTQLKGDNK